MNLFPSLLVGNVAWPCHYGLVNFYDPVYPAEEYWFAPEASSPAYSRTFDQKPVLVLVHITSVHF